jgi:RND family efflux transporter MFP subunit
VSTQRHANLAIHSDHPGDRLRGIRRTRALARLKLVAGCLLLALLTAGAFGAFLRYSQAKALAAATERQNVQYVLTAHPKNGSAGDALALPGTLQGYIEAPIAARISGYLMRWNKDIGSRVAKGEVLAEISNPESDQELAQAVAAREQLASNLQLTKVSLERWQNLWRDKAVSQQEYDERRHAYAQAQSNLAAADANIRRLKELQGYKLVKAPFAGVITRRNANVGDLVQAGGRPLFQLAQTDPLRVYVYVPQTYALRVKPGESVTVTQAELPGMKFEGKIVRTAGAIDPANRSLQTEISLPNREGKLLPGAYVNVALPAGGAQILTVPTNALLIRAEGIRVAVVDGSGKVRLQPVTVGKDFGQRVQILNGLTASDELVLNPSDSLADGDRVTVKRNDATRF